MNPIVNATFDLLTTLWNEVATVFPDDYAHLGGDEVRDGCFSLYTVFNGSRVARFPLTAGRAIPTFSSGWPVADGLTTLCWNSIMSSD